MDSFDELVQAWSTPAAWQGQTPTVIRTHGAVVFLVGERAIKLKRPVKLDFLDFSTLERRERALRDEDTLNRRLAEGVYQGVLPINAAGELGGGGPAREWALVMRRLPDSATLAARLARGAVTAEDLSAVAARLARFHDAQPRAQGADASSLMRQNLAEARGRAGGALAGPLGARLGVLLDDALRAAATVLSRRSDRAVDAHGDLRADHVYLLEAPAEPQVVVLDCVEFNPAFRALDPIADVAFLTMDLLSRQGSGPAEALWQAWALARGEPAEDPDLRALLRLWQGHWALVRAKVSDLCAHEPGMPLRALALALLAGRCLRPEPAPPTLLALGGLPASGKSTLAGWLAQSLGATWIATDAVRKRAPGPVRYTPEATAAVYHQALAEAEEALSRGESVVLDATFQEERWREAARQVAQRQARRATVALLRCDPEVGERRMRERPRGLSDADLQVLREARRRFEPAQGPALWVDNDGDVAEGAAALVAGLVEVGHLFPSDPAPGADEPAGSRYPLPEEA